MFPSAFAVYIFIVYLLFSFSIYLSIYLSCIQMSYKYIFIVLFLVTSVIVTFPIVCLFVCFSRQRLPSKQRNKSYINRWSNFSVCVFTIISQDFLKHPSLWHCSVLFEGLWQSVFKSNARIIRGTPATPNDVFSIY